MRILIVNDDGVKARGIQFLMYLLQNEHYLMVIAPATQQSCKGARITFGNIKHEVLQKNPFEILAVDSTPAMTGFFAASYVRQAGFEPELVISGINAGANLGYDAHFSGTCAAAFALRHVCTCVAISDLDYTYRNLEAFGADIKRLLMWCAKTPIPALSIWNINIPQTSTPIGVRFCKQQPYFNARIVYNEVAAYQFKCGIASQECEHQENFDITECRAGYVTVGVLQNCKCVLGLESDVKQSQNMGSV